MDDAERQRLQNRLERHPAPSLFIRLAMASDDSGQRIELLRRGVASFPGNPALSRQLADMLVDDDPAAAYDVLAACGGGQDEAFARQLAECARRCGREAPPDTGSLPVHRRIDAGLAAIAAEDGVDGVLLGDAQGQILGYHGIDSDAAAARAARCVALLERCRDSLCAIEGGAPSSCTLRSDNGQILLVTDGERHLMVECAPTTRPAIVAWQARDLLAMGQSS